MLASDFGDAPEPYPTLIAQSGAEHVAIGLTLGSHRDTENDGIPSNEADGDDSSGTPPDEDGVTFGTIQVGALDAELTVNVQGTAGKLDGWIDFNGDGNWGGEHERIFSSVDVSVGDNLLTFDVPAFAKSGPTYARFRISTSGDLGPSGLASDGEVEDYLIDVVAPSKSSAQFLQRQTIGNVFTTARRIRSVDFDGDGDVDVLSHSGDARTLSWYENDGSENFSEHAISEFRSEAMALQTVDFDNDGDLDVVTASYSETIAWHENDGSDNFTTHYIDALERGARHVYAADIDGDGDIDVLSASSDGDEIVWYENDGAEQFSLHTIHSDAGRAQKVMVVDFDGDGDMDALAASLSIHSVFLYENDGAQNFTTKTVTSPGVGATALDVADLDNDGDMDVLTASSFGDNVQWHENQNGVFTSHTLSTALRWATSVQAADLDGDGDLDVMAASFQSSQIEWYENDGNRNFSTHAFSAGDTPLAEIQAADIDSDGDLDIVTGPYNGNEIAWHRNMTPDFGDAPSPYPTLVIDDGASHDASGPQLGATRDSETDGQPDDGDDEDGVTFGTIQVGALDAAVTVNVQGGPAKLDGWIDFNGDGHWGDHGERVFVSLDVADGENHVEFDVPATAKSGLTYARFRLSTEGRLGPLGPAGDGEVEDYAITIQPPLRTQTNFVPQPEITINADGVIEVRTADLDGDGDMDVLSTSWDNDVIYWHANEGNGGFSDRLVAEVEVGITDIHAADIDNDGALEIVTASHPGNRIESWEPVDVPNPQDFSLEDLYGISEIDFADIDNDGDLDVLAPAVYSDKIGWFENDGTGQHAFRLISANYKSSIIRAADLDSDGDIDVLAPPRPGTGIDWFENNGDGSFVSRTVTTNFLNTSHLRVADIDGDGDVDVISASRIRDQLAWYENDGSEVFTKHTISSSVLAPHGLEVGDLDGDGDLDIAIATYGDGQIAWYENDGGKNFTAHVISQSATGVSCIAIADIDGDGALDIVSGLGLHSNGIVTWYRNEAIDLGDAPAPYPTLLADNGAAHDMLGAMLGAQRDNETDGQIDDGHDEDGVTFGIATVGAFAANVTVNVQNAPGKLDAWIDFNGDGSWGGQDEQIFASVDVTEGDNHLTFDVPPTALSGQTYARFRLSTEGSLGPEGRANNGEVEDHVLTLHSPASSSVVFSAPNTVTTQADRTMHVHAADLDDDGDLDLLSANFIENPIVWYENLGSDNFKARTVSSNSFNARNLQAVDVDGDGDLDVLSAATGGPSLAWHENDGNENFIRREVYDSALGASSIQAADIDGDGDVDIIGTIGYDVILNKNDGFQNFTSHVVSDNTDSTDIQVIDVDGDGDLDLIGGSNSEGKIIWFENDGNEVFTSHTISSTTTSPQSLWAADMDQDGDLDILSASNGDSTIAWYENDGSEVFTPHVITDNALGAFSIQAGDIDGDGDFDVVCAIYGLNQIIWYENDGSQTFIPRLISTALLGPTDIQIGDVDGDGDLDVISASYDDNRIAWYENINADFGDAPAPYPTSLSDDGAYHDAVGPRLGELRDSESDASVDDGADDDGVMFGELNTSLPMAGINVVANLQGSPTASVDVWIDFNADGIWDSSEQVLTSATVIEGLQTLNINMPSDAILGDTYARVRLSTLGGLAPNGPADDGEVEDYVVTIVDSMSVNVEINEGQEQRSTLTSLSVTLSGESTISPNAFSVVNRENQSVVNTDVTIDSSGGRTFATISFRPGPNVIVRDGFHSLDDGNYQLVIDAAMVPGLKTDYRFGENGRDSFFRLFGDADGDRDVDGLDLGAFGQAFLKTAGEPGYNAAFDLEGDGDIDGLDLGTFGQRFLSTMPF